MIDLIRGLCVSMCYVYVLFAFCKVCVCGSSSNLCIWWHWTDPFDRNQSRFLLKSHALTSVWDWISVLIIITLSVLHLTDYRVNDGTHKIPTGIITPTPACFRMQLWRMHRITAARQMAVIGCGALLRHPRSDQKSEALMLNCVAVDKLQVHNRDCDTKSRYMAYKRYIDGLVQDSSALAMELLQSWPKLSICAYVLAQKGVLYLQVPPEENDTVPYSFLCPWM